MGLDNEELIELIQADTLSGDESDGEEEEEEASEPWKTEAESVGAMLCKFEGYCQQLPVLGFNSARYDLNLIKKKLAKYLKLDLMSHAFTVKRNNSYICISSDDFKFLDISQYLSPGCSYAQFLVSFHCEQRKGYFPYEFLDSPTKLTSNCLPPMEAFYSSLKGHNVLEEEHLRYQKLIDEGLPEDQVLKKLKIDQPPPTKEVVYLSMQRVWEDNNMTTFADFLRWYNDLDVAPFVEAAQKMQDFYRQKSVDVFKESLSVPGIARKLLFRKAAEEQASFALFSKNDKDLYAKVSKNL